MICLPSCANRRARNSNLKCEHDYDVCEECDPCHCPEEGRLAVSGGRQFTNRDLLYATLDEVHRSRPVTVLIHGGAQGADTLAASWASDNGIPVVPLEPDYDFHGPSAPRERNTEIVELADELVAFPVKSSKGTWDAVRKARKKGIPVQVIR